MIDMAVSDRIRDIRKRNGMSQIAKALNVSVHYLMDWAEDADALAPANALSPEALHVARVYDTLDAPWKNCWREL